MGALSRVSLANISLWCPISKPHELKLLMFLNSSSAIFEWLVFPTRIRAEETPFPSSCHCLSFLTEREDHRDISIYFFVKNLIQILEYSNNASIRHGN